MNSSVHFVGQVAAVIPALNESVSIARVIEGILPYAFPIVVDDGSTDETAVIARLAGAEVVQHRKNLGYDRALDTGMNKASGLGYEFAVTLDADGQHNPELLKLFINELFLGADLVVGVRDRHQRFAESLFALIGKMFWKIKDPLCGMKGYRLSLLQRAGQFDSYTSIGTELALRAARSGCRVAEVPVSTRQREGISRFGGGLKANWRILRALFLGIIRARAFTSEKIL